MGMWWCWHGHQHLQCPQQEWTKQLDKMTWGALSSGSPCVDGNPGSAWQSLGQITAVGKFPV